MQRSLLKKLVSFVLFLCAVTFVTGASHSGRCQSLP